MGTVRVAAGRRVDFKEVDPMRILKIRHSGQFMKTTATGMAALLLLASLPGCVARHMPDWEKVENIRDNTVTRVELYEDNSLGAGPTKHKGQFYGASSRSMTIVSTDGTSQTFQRPDIRNVLVERDFGKRWAGWVALGLGFALCSGFLSDDFAPSAQVLFGIALPVAVSIPFFMGSKMGGIYEVPPNHRDWYPQGTSSPPVKGETPKTGEGGIK